MSHWIMGLFAALCGMVGLFMASAAHDFGIYAFGMLLFFGATLFCWWMIKTAFDEAEAGPAESS
ncbi:MAG: hypothetical protein JOY81_14150 [Alphaproteobacteria bacterium]|nr:hypothetical protein [Alphaproteobacteria bacterium]